MNRPPARLAVVAGPSGVGKGTVIRELRDRHPEVWLSVSATTRRPRPGERDGEHYHFVDDATFDSLVAQGDMLEWAQVFGLDRYGTVRHAVLDRLAAGHPVILELDLEGARQVRRAMPEAVQVFIAPPSFEDLARRLEGRGTEDETVRERRLATARVELAAREEFDHVIVYDDVDRAVSELAEVMGLASRRMGHSRPATAGRREG